MAPGQCDDMRHGYGITANDPIRPCMAAVEGEDYIAADKVALG